MGCLGATSILQQGQGPSLPTGPASRGSSLPAGQRPGHAPLAPAVPPDGSSAPTVCIPLHPTADFGGAPGRPGAAPSGAVCGGVPGSRCLGRLSWATRHQRSPGGLAPPPGGLCSPWLLSDVSANRLALDLAARPGMTLVCAVRPARFGGRGAQHTCGHVHVSFPARHSPIGGAQPGPPTSPLPSS